jgi:hypothetical protein
VGRANANMDKYTQEMLDNIAKESADQMKCLGFYQYLQQADSKDFVNEGSIDWIQKYN